MMEHIRQFDWCSSTVDRYFVEESDLDNCVTEKILRNKFFDPLISSDSESETPTNVIDWAEICKKRDNSTKVNHVYVPGLRGPPPFPKLSALTSQQHLQCLKVLCANNPGILEAEFMARPTKQDHKVFEEVKEIYAKERVEFQEWATSLWGQSHRLRVLRPRPVVEGVYCAEQTLRSHRGRSLPRGYQLAAQIPLAPRGTHCTLTHLQDLIHVNAADLPEIRLPETIGKRFNIFRPCSTPAPCIKHPCQFVLPNESSMSILPLTELNRELGQWAVDSGAEFVASENALKCLLEQDRPWTIPVSVCEVMDPEGDKCNVVVLGSELFISREAPNMRTYRALRHMVEHALITTAERMKVQNRSKNSDTNSGKNNETMDIHMQSDDTDTDDDRDDLFIDTECEPQNNGLETETCDTEIVRNDQNKVNGDTGNNSNETVKCNGGYTESITQDCTKDFDEIGFYSCSCKEIFVKPPPRSFKKWQVKDNHSKEKFDIIVHCSHKARCSVGEVYIEPIPEYQLDLAASLQSPDKMRSIALSLLLRRKASLLNLRVDGTSGDLVRCDKISFEEWTHAPAATTTTSLPADTTSLPAAAASLPADTTSLPTAAATLHAALAQLQGLLPGHYILQHEPEHGANAMLFAARALPGGGRRLLLDAPAPAPPRPASGPGDSAAGPGQVASGPGQSAAGPGQVASGPGQVANGPGQVASGPGQSAAGPGQVASGPGQPDGGADAEDAAVAKEAPTLIPLLLPIHKYRKVLPCAFTPHPTQLAREPPRRATRHKPPPPAIKLDADQAQRDTGKRGKWPKKKKKKKKN